MRFPVLGQLHQLGLNKQTCQPLCYHFLQLCEHFQPFLSVRVECFTTFCDFRKCYRSGTVLYIYFYEFNSKNSAIFPQVGSPFCECLSAKSVSYFGEIFSPKSVCHFVDIFRQVFQKLCRHFPARLSAILWTFSAKSFRNCVDIFRQDCLSFYGHFPSSLSDIRKHFPPSLSANLYTFFTKPVSRFVDI